MAALKVGSRVVWIKDQKNFVIGSISRGTFGTVIGGKNMYGEWEVKPDGQRDAVRAYEEYIVPT